MAVEKSWCVVDWSTLFAQKPFLCQRMSVYLYFATNWTDILNYMLLSVVIKCLKEGGALSKIDYTQPMSVC